MGPSKLWMFSGDLEKHGKGRLGGFQIFCLALGSSLHHCYVGGTVLVTDGRWVTVQGEERWGFCLRELSVCSGVSSPGCTFLSTRQLLMRTDCTTPFPLTHSRGVSRNEAPVHKVFRNCGHLGSLSVPVPTFLQAVMRPT